MLRVWRGPHRIFVECSECGSYGSTHVKLQALMEPEIQAAFDAHSAHMMSLREHFIQAVNEIVGQIRGKKIAREEGARKVVELQAHFTAVIRTAEAALPNPTGKVTEYVEQCPWCEHREHADVIQLPDDKQEPDFELAKPVKAFLDKAAVAHRASLAGAKG